MRVLEFSVRYSWRKFEQIGMAFADAHATQQFRDLGMDDVFNFPNRLIGEYSSFSRSFSKVAAQVILTKVEEEYARGRYWSEPLIHLNLTVS